MAENELEKYVPRGELSTRAMEELAEVGLSADFPVRMRELNHGLTYWGSRNSFAGLRFSLQPDETYPKVNVDEHYVSSYEVVVEAGLNKIASLHINHHRYHIGTLAILGLSQVRAFTDTYPTDETITLSANPRNIAKPGRRRTLRPVPATPFSSLAAEPDLESLGLVPGEFDIKIGFTGDKSQLDMDISYVDEKRSNEPVFWLNNFYARDTAPVIERVIGSLGSLLTQNWNVSNETPEEA